MGQRVSRNDFEWVYSEEPHKMRRKLILAKYPEVKDLMGHDPNLKYWVIGMVLIQLMSAYQLRDVSWLTVAVVAYMWGGVINHSMSLAIHEISHNLAFGNARPGANRALGIFGNMVMGIPYSVVFRKYHQEHHKYQGNDEMDMDIPSRLEGRLFYNTFTKLLWVILQPFFYTLRPVLLRPKPITRLEVINFTVQLAFNAIIYWTMGWRSLVYLISGTMLAMGLHPVAGHFISEHYMFQQGYETYSYYGLLNYITFNVGYHNEHHDFPNIPGSRLPLVKKIAPDFYDNLPYHSSWTKVIWDFIFCTDIGPYARVKRRQSQDAAAELDEAKEEKLE